MPLAASNRIGPYVIVASLGAGGMGEVYRAQDTRLRRDVALKILPAGFAHDADRLRRFEQEARTASLLNHPNIVAIYDVGMQDNTPYLVSELLHGETLGACLATGPLASRKAVEYALQIANGLAAAHEKGIVHRDLKPANLFLTRDGQIKILDFGVAKLMQSDAASQSATTLTEDAGTNPGMVLGTVGYLSPEQVRGLPIDSRSDIFSFGVILYQLLTGQRPFQGTSSPDTMSAILREDPPEISELNPKLSPGLARIVRHCLEKRPEDRFQSVRDLAFALETVSGSGTSTSSGIYPTVRSRMRFNTALGWVCAAIALALLTATLFLWRPRQIEPLFTFRKVTLPRGFITSARFAKDGKTIVYSAARGEAQNQIFATRLESPESRPLDIVDADILAIPPSGEMAVLLHPTYIGWEGDIGTLALAPLVGGATREVLARATDAAWSPDGSSLAAIHKAGDHYRVEFPIGTMLYESVSRLELLRVLPNSEGVSFIENNKITLVDRAKNKRILPRSELFPQSGIGGMAWAGRDEAWYIEGSASSSVLRSISLQGRERVIASFPPSFQLFDVSEDGRLLLGEDEVGNELMYRRPGMDRESDLSWLDNSILTDLSTDGRTILFNEDYLGVVYIRHIDGPAAIRLGEGYGYSLSPDSEWVVAHQGSPDIYDKGQLVLLPTGVGQVRVLHTDPVSNYLWATWLPDGRRIAFTGSETGHGSRCYVVDVGGGRPRAISPEGSATYSALPVSPDGKEVALTEPTGRTVLYSVEGDRSRPVAGLPSGDDLIRWSRDGRFLYHHRTMRPPVPVYRMNLETGRDELWKELRPPDLTGAIFLAPIVITPDAQSYAYSVRRIFSQLYLAKVHDHLAR